MESSQFQSSKDTIEEDPPQAVATWSGHVVTLLTRACEAMTYTGNKAKNSKKNHSPSQWNY
jgi:hypothetical protein